METFKKCRVVKLGEFIYIVSSEEIKEGDWCLINNKHVHKNIENDSIYLKEHCKKIITTTDESLTPFQDFSRPDAIPRPSLAFIEAYVKANGMIDEVLIGYEIKMIPKHSEIKLDFQYKLSYKLKVAPDGTITIKPIQNWEDCTCVNKCIGVASYHNGKRISCKGLEQPIQLSVEEAFSKYIKEETSNLCEEDIYSMKIGWNAGVEWTKKNL